MLENNVHIKSEFIGNKNTRLEFLTALYTKWEKTMNFIFH